MPRSLHDRGEGSSRAAAAVLGRGGVVRVGGPFVVRVPPHGGSPRSQLRNGFLFFSFFRQNGTYDHLQKKFRLFTDAFEDLLQTAQEVQQM